MKVILLENIDKLGKKGEVQTVKRGFARNYLIPRDLAIYATPTNMKKLGDIQAKAAVEEEKRMAELKNLAQKIAGNKLAFVRKVDENDHMFGSVSEVDICNALHEAGIEIHKSTVMLDKHIKELGEHKVNVRLHKDVVATLLITVSKENGDEELAAAPVNAPVEDIQPLEEPVVEAEAIEEAIGEPQQEELTQE